MGEPAQPVRSNINMRKTTKLEWPFFNRLRLGPMKHAMSQIIGSARGKSNGGDDETFSRLGGKDQ